jgi:RNA polymerase sigma-70 factor (ECF subfamily)
MKTGPDDDPEAEAALALARGDRRAALTVLMRAYGRPIYRHCLSALGEHGLADEVHQTVFVQAWRDLERFEGRSSFRTWLFGIARHRCLDAARSRRRFGQRFVAEAAAEPVAEAPPAEGRFDPDRVRDPLETCLGTLRPELRIAVLLRYQEGMSFVELGRVCRERPGTIEARIRRTLPQLRRCLAARGVAP